MDGVHLAGVGKGQIGAENTGILGLDVLRQGPVEQHRRILPGDAPAEGLRGDAQSVLCPQDARHGRGGIACRVPGQALFLGLLVQVGDKGASGHGQKLAPGHGEGGGQLIAADALENAQIHRLGHLLIGPVAFVQIGIVRRPGGNHGGEGQKSGQHQNAGPRVTIHA